MLYPTAKVPFPTYLRKLIYLQKKDGRCENSENSGEKNAIAPIYISQLTDMPVPNKKYVYISSDHALSNR